MDGVAVEQIGDMADGTEAAGAASLVVVGPRAAEMGGEHRQPGFVEVLVDHRHERPHGPLRKPRVVVGLDARCRGQRTADQTAGERELDVGAHAVLTVGGGSEDRRQPLAQPPLDAPGGYGDELGRERIVERVDDHGRERLYQTVRPLGSVDRQHRSSPAGRRG